MKKILLLLIFCLLNLQSLAFDKDAEVLDEIKQYQTQYFTIIQKNNILFWGSEDYNSVKIDEEKLNNLFLEIENKVKSKISLKKKYDKIENNYKDKYLGLTIPETTPVLWDELSEYDDLLNKVYLQIKKEIPVDEFKKLEADEISWNKSVEDYYLNSNKNPDFSIRTDMYFRYKINALKFRILLLMLY